jgi:hypothetical protein
MCAGKPAAAGGTSSNSKVIRAEKPGHYKSSDPGRETGLLQICRPVGAERKPLSRAEEKSRHLLTSRFRRRILVTEVIGTISGGKDEG